VLPLLLALTAPLVQDWTPPPPPPTVPTLAMAQPRFAPFSLPEKLRVVTSVVELQPLAGVLADQLADRTGLEVKTAPGPARSGDVVLTLGYTAEAVGESPEALSIEVFEDHVALSGRTEAGVARAAARLLQLLTPTEGGGWVLPPFRLDDAPRFRWRGVRLEGLPSEDDGRRLLELLFLGSFNVLVLEAPPTDARAALARALQPVALAHGVDLVLDPPAGPGAPGLPFVSSGADAAPGSSGPVLVSGLGVAGAPAGAIDPLLAAGRTLIDGRSGALQFVGEGTPALGPRELYAWSPLALLGSAKADLAEGSASLVIGSEVHLAGTGAIPRFQRALPFLAERSWGATDAPAELEDFQPRASRLLELLGEPRAEEGSAPASGASRDR